MIGGTNKAIGRFAGSIEYLNVNDERDLEKLEEANHQLRDSLKACHELVAQYRSKLAANGNDPTLPDEGERDSDTARS